MTHVAAIDPGLDATGIALFDVPHWPPRLSFESAVKCLERYGVIRTDPATPLPRRCYQLQTGLQDYMHGGVTCALLEVPTIAGTYSRTERFQRGKRGIIAAPMAALNRAIGALAAACEAVVPQVITIPAPKIKKHLRAQYTLATLQRQNHPISARKKVSKDLLDAIWLGATWLSDPLRLRESA